MTPNAERPMSWHERREVKAAYEHSWRAMLQALLGWSESDAATWAKAWIDRLGDSEWLEHETAAWYVVPLLIPPPGAGNDPRLNHLRGDLERAIHSDPGLEDEPIAGARWAAAADRVDRLLREHGWSLAAARARPPRLPWG